MSKVYHGSCVCGSVKIELSGPPERVMACYCSDCRKNSGNLGQINARYKVENVKTIDPENNVADFVQTKTASGQPKHKYFCRNCGCTIRTAPEVAPGLTFVRYTILDDADDAFQPAGAINEDVKDKFTGNVKCKYYCNV